MTIELSNDQVGNRSVRLDDQVLAWDTTPGLNPPDRPRRDSLRTIWRRLWGSVPTDLTTAEKDSVKAALSIVDPEDELPPHDQINREFLAGSRGVVSFEPINEVPDTPGTQSGIGHVLTVRGENDQDYHWAPPPTGGGGGDTSGLSSRITTNANDIGELQRERTTDRQSIADNEGRITTAETDINNLEAEDSTLAASIAGNTTATQTNAGNIQTNSNLIAAVTRTAQSLVTEVDTLHPKIGRLVPITPWVRNNEARTLRFAWFPLAAVSTSDTLRMSIGGVAHTPRVTEGYAATDVSGIVLSVPVSAANSATITRESNTTAGFVRVDLVMDRAQFHCYIPAEDAPATAPQSRILLAATLATTTDQVTLPTSYPTFKWFTVVGANSSGGSGSVTVPTSWLAAHTATGTFTYPTTQNGQTGSFTWGVALRIIRADSDSSIQYAELHD